MSFSGASAGDNVPLPVSELQLLQVHSKLRRNYHTYTYLEILMS